jgi:predicted DCC family thiol-disulfide oxidoreductase YuxK
VLPDASASPLAHLFPNVLAIWDAPAFVIALIAIAAGLSVLFAIGLYDRVAAVAIWYIWACLFGRNPLIANPSLPFVGWMLLAHACLPPGPYGSWAARGRPDPGCGWRMPQPIFVVAWIVMAVGYSYSGFTKLVSPSWLEGTALARVLDNPLARPGLVRDALLILPEWLMRLATWGALALELGFAPLALWRRLRPWLWGAMLAMHLGLVVVIDFADLSLGMVMLHLFTFDPAWVRPRRAGVTEMIFYDGHCGLCHRAVRFLLAEDRVGDTFRFAPLGSDAFLAVVPEPARTQLPDSLVLRTSEGELLTRSAAVLHAMRRLGGAWRVLAAAVSVLPASLRDWLYDGVARVRYRLFRPPADACPITPPHLRSRFDR